MKETWKDIKGYEGLYRVSDNGRIMNSSGKMLKGSNHGGYRRVKLSKEEG